MLYTLSQKNTSVEKYIKHGFLWKGHGSIETFHVMDHVAPLPKSEYLELIQEPFFFFLELWTSLQSYRCPQAQSSSWLPNLQPESSGWYGLVPQVVKHSKRLHPAALSWSLQTLSIQESSPAAHHLSRLQGHLSRVEININASFLGYLSSKSPKFLNSLCCNSILSRSSFSSFSHSAFFFDHLSSISS